MAAFHWLLEATVGVSCRVTEEVLECQTRVMFLPVPVVLVALERFSRLERVLPSCWFRTMPVTMRWYMQ